MDGKNPTPSGSPPLERLSGSPLPRELDSILLIKFSSIGDIVHTTALVHHLRLETGARISWAVDSGFADLLEEHPDVDRLIRFPRDPFPPAARPRGGHVSGLFRFLGQLREETYDAAIDLQGRLRSYLTLEFCHARIKIGRGRFPLRNRVPQRKNVRRHAVDASFESTALLGISDPEQPRLFLPSCARKDARVRDWLKDSGISRPFACLIPAAGRPEKRWPLRNWAETARWLIDRGLGVVLIGSKTDAGLALELDSIVSERIQLASSFGELTLGELISLFGLATVVVGGDTGPLHIASAGETPVVGIFGPTDPERVGPRPLDRSRILVAPGCRMCQPYYRSWADLRRRCREPCMESLEPKTVIGAISGILAGADQRCFF